VELTGFRFGRLVAESRTNKGKRVAWVCLCDCGVRTIKAQVDLRSGDTTSCGCRKNEVTAARNTTHGMAHTPAYKKWLGMKARVRNASRQENRCYVGVTICQRWHLFKNFLADMGEPPDGYSLDRKDNNKGYSKSNCRWVPLVEQSRNTRRLRMHEGVCISQAARENGLSPDVVLDRVNKLGWTIDEALSTPKRKQRKANAQINTPQTGIPEVLQRSP
jgi:hypothetical protein